MPEIWAGPGEQTLRAIVRGLVVVNQNGVRAMDIAMIPDPVLNPLTSIVLGLRKITRRFRKKFGELVVGGKLELSDTGSKRDRGRAGRNSDANSRMPVHAANTKTAFLSRRSGNNVHSLQERSKLKNGGAVMKTSFDPRKKLSYRSVTASNRSSKSGGR